MKRIAILIAAHKPIPYIDHRVDVKWGGFSQVQVTLNLFKTALLDSKAHFFHFISGEDVFLYSNPMLIKKLSWDNDQIYMQMVVSKDHQYRVKFVAFHVEKGWQRKLFGKAFTFFLRVLDKVFPAKKKIWFGSSWFSIRREEIEKIIENISCEDIKYFQKRLNSDEHFFQYLIIKNGMIDKITDNRRYIVFDDNYQHGSSPIFLDLEILNNLNDKNYWFSRKVEQKVIIRLLENRGIL